jgi:hypothetical protein
MVNSFSGLWILNHFGRGLKETAGRCLLGNGYLEAQDDLSNLDFVSILQHDIGQFSAGSCSRWFVNPLLANLAAVDKGTVPASHVAYPHLGRIYVEQAMVTRDVQSRWDTWKLQITIAGTTHSAERVVLEKKFLAIQNPAMDGERD